uniref:Rae1 protein homolog n=1 Tax=Oncorhynchus mykiss TaxID=8022 RepID=A0A8K9XS13_ONCMY
SVITLESNILGGGGWGSSALSMLQNVEVSLPPDDSISCMAFIPPTMPGNFHIQGSWANDVSDSGLGSVAQQMHTGHVLDICWSDDRNKVLLASCDKTAKMWDLNRNQDDDKMILMKTHVYPLARWHWIKTTDYSCIMTGSWDKTLKIDTCSPNPIMSLQMPERTVLAIAERGLPFPFLLITYCFSLSLLCTGGRMDNFIFKCHKSNGTNTANLRPCYWRVNAISFHPVHGTMSTVGPDRRLIFWYKDARTKLKTSEQLDIPITTCCFHNNGNIFAYASSFDWSKEHEYYNPQKNTKYIFLPNAAEEQDMVRKGHQKWCWLWG